MQHNIKLHVKVIEDYIKVFGDPFPISFCNDKSKIQIINESMFLHFKAISPNNISYKNIEGFTPLELIKNPNFFLMKFSLYENYYMNLSVISTGKSTEYSCFSILDEKTVWGGMVIKKPVYNNDSIVGVLTQNLEQKSLTLSKLYWFLHNSGYTVNEIIAFLKAYLMDMYPRIRELSNRELYFLLHSVSDESAKISAVKFNLQGKVINNYLYVIRGKLGNQFKEITEVLQQKIILPQSGLIYRL